MTITEFENTYWYMSELKAFAKSLKIPVDSKIRKDQLEKTIIQFLETGTVNQKNRFRSKNRDRDILNNSSYVENFSNKKETWAFIHSEMDKRIPGLKPKSGAKYWLNRWIENKLSHGKKITYDDVICEYIRLNQTEGRLPQIPSCKFNNFISDYLANEKNATREDALDAWTKLKDMKVKKDYITWKKNKNT
ncbi:SAP domain-containing protein [Treponema socranskii]|uniref:SAP domain-containing protein n=1 Tax=Treponema socranskii TaxID=53419 RepID=UPI0028EDDEF9|nr:SAP domain-containing protein [Treponema socranskii]